MMESMHSKAARAEILDLVGLPDACAHGDAPDRKDDDAEAAQMFEKELQVGVMSCRCVNPNRRASHCLRAFMSITKTIGLESTAFGFSMISTVISRKVWSNTAVCVKCM